MISKKQIIIIIVFLFTVFSPFCENICQSFLPTREILHWQNLLLTNLVKKDSDLEFYQEPLKKDLQRIQNAMESFILEQERARTKPCTSELNLVQSMNDTELTFSSKKPPEILKELLQILQSWRNEFEMRVKKILKPHSFSSSVGKSGLTLNGPADSEQKIQLLFQSPTRKKRLIIFLKLLEKQKQLFLNKLDDEVLLYRQRNYLDQLEHDWMNDH